MFINVDVSLFSLSLITEIRHVSGAWSQVGVIEPDVWRGGADADADVG